MRDEPRRPPALLCSFAADRARASASRIRRCFRGSTAVGSAGGGGGGRGQGTASLPCLATASTSAHTHTISPNTSNPPLGLDASNDQQNTEPNDDGSRPRAPVGRGRAARVGRPRPVAPRKGRPLQAHRQLAPGQPRVDAPQRVDVRRQLPGGRVQRDVLGAHRLLRRRPVRGQQQRAAVLQVLAVGRRGVVVVGGGGRAAAGAAEELVIDGSPLPPLGEGCGAILPRRAPHPALCSPHYFVHISVCL